MKSKDVDAKHAVENDTTETHVRIGTHPDGQPVIGEETEIRVDGKQPSSAPSFAATEDEPLVTAGTGGSEEPQGKVRPGGGAVPADSEDRDRRDDAQERGTRR